MEWFVIGVVAIVGLASLFGGSSKQKAQRPKRVASGTRRKATYAAIERNGSVVELQPDDVAELFAPFQETIKRLKPLASKLEKAAQRFHQTDEVNETIVAEGQRALVEASRARADAEKLYDQMWFDTDRAGERWWKVVDQLDEVDATLEDALTSIAETREHNEEGEVMGRRNPADGLPLDPQ